MSLTRPKTKSKSLAAYHAGIVRMLLAGMVLCSVGSHREVLAGMLGGGPGSGTLAKLQFRLSESFYPTSVAWSPDARYIVTGSTYAQTVDIWDVEQRKLVKELLIPSLGAYSHEISFSPDGRYLAACDATGMLHIYYAGTWLVAHEFKELHKHGGCDHPVFSSDSKRIAMLAVRFLEVFSVPEWHHLKHLELDNGSGKGDLFNAIGYLPNSHTVIVAGGGPQIDFINHGVRSTGWEGRVWLFCAQDMVPSRSVRVFGVGGEQGGGGDVRSMAISPDGRYVVAGAATGTGAPPYGVVTQSVHVVGIADGQLIAAPLDDADPSKFGKPESIVYTHDGRYIIVPHDVVKGWIHVLDGATFKLVDLFRSDAFNFDVAVNQVNDEFAVGTGKQVIVWSFIDR
jgi:DNA-binding beta-propeller fold protein YncE